MARGPAKAARKPAAGRRAGFFAAGLRAALAGPLAMAQLLLP